MDTLQIGLVLATLLCSLVAGFLFSFAVVAMPGMADLGDREFLRSFQAMDRVIQNHQPLFVVVWVGSAVTLLGCAAIGVGRFAGLDRSLLLAATVVYMVGVQVPTLTLNVPLNNQLQALDLDAMDDGALVAARVDFEPRWNRWNQVRTVFATLTSVLLIILVLRL